jgi:hypothetical protein
MINKYVNFLLVIVAIMWLSACNHQMPTAKQVLDQAYPAYDKKHACWIALDKENGERFCMKLDSEKTITIKNKQRRYILVAGGVVDENGEPDGGHASMGAVGAFVVENNDGDSAIIASNPVLHAGTYGVAPTAWKLLQLGSADYWGWLNTSGDCHMGYCGSAYYILAPYGKSIRNLSKYILDSYDNTGACDGMVEKLDENGNSVLDESGNPIEVESDCFKTTASMQTTLKIDTQNTKERVYPLLITVTGNDRRKVLKPKVWVFNFDVKNWTYKEPADYPLADREL